MSPQSPLDLPPISPALTPIVPFLQRANELRNQDPVMAYWCAYHAAQLGISLKAKDSASRDVLFALLSFLERFKKEIGPSDALDIESVSSAYVENFAIKVFAMADNEDRSGFATRGTAKKFLAAAHFLQVLKTFPKVDVSEPVEEKIKYAKWKAVDIAKAFREGRKPTSGPAGSNLPENLEATPSTSLPPDKKDILICDDEYPSIATEVSPPVTLAEVSQAPLATLPHTPPRFGLDVKSFEHGAGTLGTGNGEATPGSWSTTATPGTAQGPPEHWEGPVSPTRGAYTLKPPMPKRKPWVSEDLEGKDESEYLRLSVDTAKGPTTTGDYPEKSVLLPESRASASAPCLPTQAEQTYPHVAEQQLNGAMDDHASNYRSQPSGSPTHQPTELDMSTPGFMLNLHPTWPTSAVHSSHAGYVSAPSIEARPESHYDLYVPASPSQHQPPTAVELTPSVIAKAQKHCRFAISSLDYEDAEQARKELRAALAILGDT